MPRQLLNLRNVPDDEADEVRALLREHGIEFYETPPNPWGISMGGIWIREQAEFRRARRLMDEYQERRARLARSDYLERKRRGEADTLLDVIKRRPGQVMLYTAVAAGILVLFMLPVWLLW